MKFKNFEATVFFILGSIYILTGLMQFFAIFDFLHLHYSKEASFIVATIIGYLPVIGSIFGGFAVVKAWGFSIHKLLLLFIPISFVMLFVSFLMIKEKISEAKRK